MHINEYVAMQLHKMREIEMRTHLNTNRAVAEAIMLEKQEIRKARKKGRK